MDGNFNLCAWVHSWGTNKNLRPGPTTLLGGMVKGFALKLAVLKTGMKKVGWVVWGNNLDKMGPGKSL